MKKIAVFCASSIGFEPIFEEQAYLLGQTLAQKGIELVYGGSKVGLMGAVANGVIDNKGKATGVLPRFLKERELQHGGLTELILVDTMHERKAKMTELSDGIIALPGSFGTLEELFEALTWSQLGLHQSPVAILNINGYYDELFAFIQKMTDKGFLKQAYKDALLIGTDINELLEKMENHQVLSIPKWGIKHELKQA